MNKKLMIRASAAFIVFCAFWSVVYAAYWIYAPDQSITSSSYVLTNFTITPGSINVGENVTLSVTLDVNHGAGPIPVPGALIHFYQGHQPGGVEIGTATTDGTGTASLSYRVNNYGQIWFYPGYEVT
jgi:hypothetical protein